ncbi:MAG: rRNA adenine dimethyltransferase family protein, partial [bacterium]
MSQKLFNPDYLYHLCQKYKLSPSKKYGQNFLIDPEPIAKMIEAAEIKKKDTVVEIGPGFGVLTFALVEKAGKVVAFEIEKKLKPYWDTACHHLDTACHPEAKTTCPDSVRKDLPRLEIVWGNVLKEFSADVIVKSERRLPAFGGKQSNPQQRDCRVAALLAMTRYKVIANLPYQITSNVIRIFLEAKNPPELMVLMVQKEVAERICAKPGQMSLLSV